MDHLILIKTKNRMRRKVWGCPRTKNRSNWCYKLCVPQQGMGECGRVAPHALLGRKQRAILNFKLRAQEQGDD